MIRRLRESDVESLIALRREALEAHPSAFSSSPESDVALDAELLRAFLRRISTHGLFGAFDPGLVGMAGVHRHGKQKESHKAELSGMYVRPSHRGRGLGAALVAACVEHARSWRGVSQLHLAVADDAEAARSLYAKSGFTTWGSEPAGLRVGAEPVTIHHMVLRLGEEGRSTEWPVRRAPSRSELSDGRVRVRRYRTSDAAPLREAALESVPEVGPWLPWCRPGLSLAECRSWLESQERSWNRGEEFEFRIEDAAGGGYLGGCGLNAIDRNLRMANLGFWVRTSACGQGVAPAATRLVARFGFEELDLLRIELVTAVGNARSQRVAEKAGARREGVLRNRLLLHGASHDAVVYSLIPADRST